MFGGFNNNLEIIRSFYNKNYIKFNYVYVIYLTLKIEILNLTFNRLFYSVTSV